MLSALLPLHIDPEDNFNQKNVQSIIMVLEISRYLSLTMTQWTNRAKSSPQTRWKRVKKAVPFFFSSCAWQAPAVYACSHWSQQLGRYIHNIYCPDTTLGVLHLLEHGKNRNLCGKKVAQRKEGSKNPYKYPNAAHAHACWAGIQSNCFRVIRVLIKHLNMGEGHQHPR